MTDDELPSAGLLCAQQWFLGCSGTAFWEAALPLEAIVPLVIITIMAGLVRIMEPNIGGLL